MDDVVLGHDVLSRGETFAREGATKRDAELRLPALKVPLAQVAARPLLEQRAELVPEVGSRLGHQSS